MIYNTAENISYCKDFVDSVFSLLIYSHFFPIIAAITSLIIVLMSKSSYLVKKVFFGVVVSFVLWVFSNLAIWIYYDNSEVMLLAWSNIEIFSTAVFIYLLYFIYILIYEKDVTNKIKIIWIALLTPIIIFSFSKYHMLGIDLAQCVVIENKLYLYYVSSVKLTLSIWLLIILFHNTLHNVKKRKAIKIAGLGALVFFLSFFTMGYLASVTGDYKLEFYGLFGMLIFIVTMAFAVNHYKIISLKIISTELLVLAIILLVSSQFLYLQNILALILNAITFIFIAILGFMLIRNIKKEIEIREMIQENAIKLDQANHNQQSLLHFITHQVKGYMTKSRNIFDAMIVGDYGELSDKVKEMAKYGFESDTRAVETVQSILRASDLKTGRIEFKKEKANLSAMVAEVIEYRQDLAHDKNIDLTFDIDPNIETLVDPLQIKEVFKNLITNAVIYTPKGNVHVSLKREPGHVRFSVVDTGVGLTSQDKEKLFTEGGKGVDSISVNIDSTGYGLYIAKKIVQQHNGKIDAHSEGRNEGSEFFVILPDLK